MIKKTFAWSLFAALSIWMLWLSTRLGPPVSTLETVGFLSGLLWIWFLIKENPWGWLAGIVSSTAYVVFFYQGKLFGDAALNVLYIILNILGWYWWVRGVEPGKELEITRVNAATLLVLAGAATVGTALLVPHFREAQSPVPLPDGTLICSALAAQYLQARKKIENWPFWIVVNAGYVAVYIYKGWYATAVLTTVYAIMAIVGWRGWLLRLKAKTAAPE